MYRGGLFQAAAAMAIFAIFVSGPNARADSGEEFIGLWKAQRLYGPVARGKLVVTRADDAYRADMMGALHPVVADGAGISFELPDDQGEFSGKLLRSGEIRGHWRQGDMNFASPVTLMPSRVNRWEGDVRPIDNAMTLYLKIDKRADGSLGAFLRNPERNVGVFTNVDRLVREGNAVTLIGKQFGRGEERALLKGVYDPENDLLTVFYPNRGGSYDFRREGENSLFYPRGKIPAPYAWRPPLARDDGWMTGTLEEAGIDRGGIERLVQSIIDTPIDSVEAPEIHGLLIARHGKLVVEEYFHGEHRDKPHDTRSAAKSLTAVIVGAAMRDGAPLSLSNPVYKVMNGGKFPEELEPQKRAMTLEHLLTMSSGFFCDDSNPDAPGNEDGMWDQSDEPDFYRYTMRVPMATPPGERAVYCSASPNLALGMVGKATGESPMAVFDRLVGAPMQIERYGWAFDPAGQPYGGGAVWMLPRDFMKFGQLMLDGGTWRGKRILSRAFAERATSRLYHLRNLYYGYLWWGIDYPYKDRIVSAYYAVGNGGQFVAVVPELDLVVATYGGNYARLAPWLDMIAQSILPAVREAGDDPSAPVMPVAFKSPYGRSDIAGPVTPEEAAQMSSRKR